MNIKSIIKKNKRLFGICRMIIFISLLVWCVDSGNILWFMLGLMIYGAWLKRDMYKTFLSWYKSALIYYWNRPNMKDKEESPPEFNLGDQLGVGNILLNKSNDNSKRKKKKKAN